MECNESAQPAVVPGWRSQPCGQSPGGGPVYHAVKKAAEHVHCRFAHWPRQYLCGVWVAGSACVWRSPASQLLNALEKTLNVSSVSTQIKEHFCVRARALRFDSTLGRKADAEIMVPRPVGRWDARL